MTIPDIGLLQVTNGISGKTISLLVVDTQYCVIPTVGLSIDNIGFRETQRIMFTKVEDDDNDEYLASFSLRVTINSIIIGSINLSINNDASIFLDSYSGAIFCGLDENNRLLIIDNLEEN